jgi:hypothetical protein
MQDVAHHLWCLMDALDTLVQSHRRMENNHSELMRIESLLAHLRIDINKRIDAFERWEKEQITTPEKISEMRRIMLQAWEMRLEECAELLSQFGPVAQAA